MEDFLNQANIQDTIVTPESLAWRMLLNSSIENFAGSILPFVIDGDSTRQKHEQKQEQNTNTWDENLSSEANRLAMLDQFQILITIYMEMVFGILKIKHVKSNLNTCHDIDQNISLNDTFTPDLSEFSVNDMIDVFREKFKKICIFLSIREIHDADKNNPRDYGSASDYYCRVILRDMPDGDMYFCANQHIIDPDKRYTFAIRNDDKKAQKKLDDFYAVVTLPKFKVRISFSQINHMARN